MQGDRVVILPILFRLTIADLQQISPSLAGKAAASWSEGIDAVADQVERRIKARPQAPVSVVAREKNEAATRPVAKFPAGFV